MNGTTMRAGIPVTAAMYLLAAFCVGCTERPELGLVEGKVTMDGRPLANAAVLFVPEDGRPAGARTNGEGKYVLNFTAGRQGAMLGRNIVRILTSRDPSETRDGRPIPAVPETVPLKYNFRTTLEFHVKPDIVNVADFDLDSAGPTLEDYRRR
jgi:hypothetical protein